MNRDCTQTDSIKLMGLQYRIVYKKGCDNGVADALSRRPHTQAHLLAISSVQPVWLEDIVASYQHDPKASYSSEIGCGYW
jgi:hypothetical protein